MMENISLASSKDLLTTSVLKTADVSNSVKNISLSLVDGQTYNIDQAPYFNFTFDFEQANVASGDTLTFKLSDNINPYGVTSSEVFFPDLKVQNGETIATGVL
ncbi:Ig-like domain-containing protein [Staphylococcus rostri]|uniref:Ig-like domain-containing protein n=1 Tax=Staphylococcus rostri TaxID=522262 RepID=UPI002852B5B4|nr:Ig-like domain-containing protein [Staphylococcus rostri]